MKWIATLLFFQIGSTKLIFTQELYTAPAANTQTRWVSPENPTGEKGNGGKANHGGKGSAFYIVQPGETKVLMDVKGAGIIQKMWMSGTIGTSREQRRAVRIDMFWDGAATPAVSAPVGDFFGMAHGLLTRFDNALFQSPEARSFNVTIPMPFRKAALISITNESPTEVWIWYDINFLSMEELPPDALYFHTYWSRNTKTSLGKDFTILPEIKGIGRFIGSNIGVLGDTMYNLTWFGEGEVKIFLDGDDQYPTLVGTGTEDYIGSGWGQGEFAGRNFGSLIANEQYDIYGFYRYHLPDPVYFHQDCRVTIQQMGSGSVSRLRELNLKGANIQPVGYLGNDGKRSQPIRLLEQSSPIKLESPKFPENVYPNFYRSDDVCATAYFYLNQPENKLPLLPAKELRMIRLKERVWDKIK
jgi:hypothetical protein